MSLPCKDSQENGDSGIGKMSILGPIHTYIHAYIYIYINTHIYLKKKKVAIFNFHNAYKYPHIYFKKKGAIFNFYNAYKYPHLSNHWTSHPNLLQHQWTCFPADYIIRHRLSYTKNKGWRIIWIRKLDK